MSNNRQFATGEAERLFREYKLMQIDGSETNRDYHPSAVPGQFTHVCCNQIFDSMDEIRNHMKYCSKLSLSRIHELQGRQPPATEYNYEGTK